MRRLEADVIFYDNATKTLLKVTQSIASLQSGLKNLNTTMSGASSLPVGLYKTMAAEMKNASKATEYTAKVTKQKATADASALTTMQRLSGGYKWFTTNLNQSNKHLSHNISLMRTLRYSILNWYIMIQAVKSFVRAIEGATIAVDDYNRGMAKLGLVSKQFGGSSPPEAIFNRIVDAANDARVGIKEFRDAYVKLGMQTEGVFGSSNELMSFLGLIQKGFKISGTGAEEQRSAMLQLTQALASGRLQGDELRTIREAFPMLINYIKKSLGVTHEEFRKMAREGEISAEVIKSAIFGAKEEIEKQWKQLPLTFGEVFQRVRNDALVAFQPVYKRLGEFANSEAFAGMMQRLGQVIQWVADKLIALMDKIEALYRYTQENKGVFDSLVNVLKAVAAAMVIAFGAKAIAMVGKFFLALLPLNWVQLAITAIVVGVMLWAKTSLDSGRTIGQVLGSIAWGFGFLVGAFISGFAIINNLLVGLMYGFDWVMNMIMLGIANLLAVFINAWWQIREDAENAWYWVVYTFEMAAYDIQRGVILLGAGIEGVFATVASAVQGIWTSIVNGIINGINAVIDKAVSLASKVPGAAEFVTTLKSKHIEEYRPDPWYTGGEATAGAYAKIGELVVPQLKVADYSGNMTTGADIFKGWGGKTQSELDTYYSQFIKDVKSPSSYGDSWKAAVESMFMTGAFDSSTSPSRYDYIDEYNKRKEEEALMNQVFDGLGGGTGGGTGGGGTGSGGRIGSVGEIEKPIELSDDAMKLLSKMAEMSFAQRYQMVAPNVHVELVANYGGGASTETNRELTNELMRMINEKLATNMTRA